MMTRDDTARILAVLKAAYPHAFKGMTRPDAEAMLNLWAIQFEADPPEIVNAAVNALIATRTAGYSPTVGEVKEQMVKLRHQNDMDEAAAWACVSAACRNGIYGYQEEFDKLPPEVQRVVGKPEQLRQWAMMDEETVQSVVASNFQRSYRTRQAQEKERAMLPASVLNVIGGVAEQMRLPA